MYGLFASVTPYVKQKPKGDVPKQENLIFKLHYKFTFVALLVASILVSTYAYIDKSEKAIQCLVDKGTGIKEDIIDRYCFAMSTYTLPKHFQGVSGKDNLYHGVGAHNEDDEKVFHAYYQWVPIVLALQAIVFYIPHWLWKTIEGGKMKRDVEGLKSDVEKLNKNKEDQEKVTWEGDLQKLTRAIAGFNPLLAIENLFEWEDFRRAATETLKKEIDNLKGKQEDWTTKASRAINKRIYDELNASLNEVGILRDTLLRHNGNEIQKVLNEQRSLQERIEERKAAALAEGAEPVDNNDDINRWAGEINKLDRTLDTLHKYEYWTRLDLNSALFQLEPVKERVKEGSKGNEYDAQLNNLAEYLRQRVHHKVDDYQWTWTFFFCECLNFINVIAQIFVTDRFLGGQFTKYGTEVLNFPYIDPENRVDPMSRIFPRMTKCMFHKFGGSGTIQRFDALCVLSMNILNEKIYIFLWFWFIVLALVTGLGLMWRMYQIFVPNFGSRVEQLRELNYGITPALNKQIHQISENSNYIDWLVLHYLAQSLNNSVFEDLLVVLLSKLTDGAGDGDDFDGGSDKRDATMKSFAKLRDYIPMKNMGSQRV